MPMREFRFWCQKVLPLVYDDSLSYYEVLNKMVDYINKYREDLGILSSEYLRLTQYVNDYFNNLDVQEEVNNVIQSMVDSGAFEDIVNPLVVDATSEWLEDNVTPTGSAVLVDSSLSISGAAADAKVTGDEISNLKSDLNYGLTAPSGYVLRATNNGHGNEWAMVGTPTDAQAETAINAWLDEHPEATTTVQDGSLTLPKFKDGELPFVTPEQFGAKGNGVVDDTTAFQSAVDSGKGLVLCSKGKTYKVGSIVPSSNTTINLNGSKLFLANGTELPVFYDADGENFAVINGVIDCNMANNHSANQSAGCFWLTRWNGINIHDIEVIHAYRNVINLWSCENVNISNIVIHDSGVSGDSRFTYGATFEPTCKNVFVKNFYMYDCYGYGLHFNETENFVLENAHIKNLTGSSRIGITLTKAKNGKINNIDFSTITNIGLEINASQKVVISNAILSNCGGGTITMGDNGTQIYNERITFKNCETISTGGNYALLFNWAKKCEFVDCMFDKNVTTTIIVAPLGSENIFKDCVFNAIANGWFFKGDRFFADNCVFSDFTIIKKDKYNLIFSCVIETIGKNGGTATISLSEPYSANGANGYIWLNNVMQSNFQQRALQKIPFNISAIGSSELVVGSSYRVLDASYADTVLTLTNNKDVDIRTAVTFDFKILPRIVST